MLRVVSRLREYVCPHCGAVGNLHGHGWSRGCAEGSQGLRLRGRRVLCSRRHRKQGCGRTCIIRLMDCIAFHTVGSATLWRFFAALCAGATVAQAWEQARTRFSLESARRWHQRLRRNLPLLRATLCRVHDPPMGAKKEPLAVTGEHLELCFGNVDPIAAFQNQLQLHFPCTQ